MTDLREAIKGLRRAVTDAEMAMEAEEWETALAVVRERLDAVEAIGRVAYQTR